MIEGYLHKTEKFYGKEYKVNNFNHRKLAIVDICLVHPTLTSQSKEPYKVQIVLDHVNWVGNPSAELCTSLHSIERSGYKAVINENLFSRLEPIRL